MQTLHPLATILAPYAAVAVEQGALPPFRVGQIWSERQGARYSDDFWKVVAITDHSHSPVIVQHVGCGAAREYGLDGMYGDEPDGMDLATLVRP